MKADPAPTSEKPKIPLPTLSQINADRITQVSMISEVSKHVSQCCKIPAVSLKISLKRCMYVV